MDSIHLITKRRTNGEQLEQVARLTKIIKPEEYKNDWEYLYEILKPVHSNEKSEKKVEHIGKKYPPKIFGGRTLGVGTR